MSISYLSKKFKVLTISAGDNSNIGSFYLNSGGLYLNDKGPERLAINLSLKFCKLWCELEHVNYDYGKEMLDEKH